MVLSGQVLISSGLKSGLVLILSGLKSGLVLILSGLKCGQVLISSGLNGRNLQYNYNVYLNKKFRFKPVEVHLTII